MTTVESPRAHRIVNVTATLPDNPWRARRQRTVLARELLFANSNPIPIGDLSGASSTNSESTYTYSSSESEDEEEEVTKKKRRRKPKPRTAKVENAPQRRFSNAIKQVKLEQNSPALKAGDWVKIIPRIAPPKADDLVQDSIYEPRKGYIVYVHDDPWEHQNSWPYRQYYYAVQCDDGLFCSVLEEKRLMRDLKRDSRLDELKVEEEMQSRELE